MKFKNRFRLNALFFAAWLSSAAILFSGCASPAATRAPAAGPATAAPSPTVAIRLVPTASPTAAAALPSATPSASSNSGIPTRGVTPPLSPSKGQLTVLATDLPSPDDLVLGPDGLVYFSDVADGTIKRLESSGAVTLLLSGLSEPEGMVFLPDGSLIIAEQGKDRLLKYDLGAKQMSPLLQLENRTGQPGVDGIAWDPRSGTLLVPDSPNGRLLQVSPDGKQTAIIASGFARPTGAAVEADGAILVVDENGAALFRVARGTRSAPRVIDRLPVPDDVVIGSDGSIYVNTLNEGAVHRIDPATGKDTVIVQGLSNPQGIVLDAAGDLVIADAGRHRLVRLALR